MEKFQIFGDLQDEDEPEDSEGGLPGGVSTHATRVERLLQHLGQLAQSHGCVLGQPGSIIHM